MFQITHMQTGRKWARRFFSLKIHRLHQVESWEYNISALIFLSAAFGRMCFVYAPDDSRALDYRSLNCFEVRSALLVSLSHSRLHKKSPLDSMICSTSAYGRAQKTAPGACTLLLSLCSGWRECNELDSCILLTALIPQQEGRPSPPAENSRHKNNNFI